MSKGRVPFLDPRKTSCFVRTLLRSGNWLTQMKTAMNNFTDWYRMFSKAKVPRGGWWIRRETIRRELSPHQPPTDQGSSSLPPPHPLQAQWQHTEKNNFGGMWCKGKGQSLHGWLKDGTSGVACPLSPDGFSLFTERSRKAALSPRLCCSNKSRILAQYHESRFFHHVTDAGWWWNGKYRQGNPAQQSWLTEAWTSGFHQPDSRGSTHMLSFAQPESDTVHFCPSCWTEHTGAELMGSIQIYSKPSMTLPT